MKNESEVFEINEKVVLKSTVGIVVFFIVMFLIMNSVRFIGPGEAAVVFNKFKGMSNITLREGINFVNPITVKSKTYDLKLQKSEFQKIEGMSADNQTITLSLAINWKLQSNHLKEIYQTIIGNVEDTVMHNVVYEVAKADLGKYKIGDIAVNREALRKDVETNLKERMAKYYIDIVNISIVDVQFSEEYEKAIEAKQVAQQKALEAEYTKQAKIREAEGQAKSNELLQQTATPKIIQLKWIERWDGVLPTVMSDKSNMLLDIGKAAQ